MIIIALLTYSVSATRYHLCSASYQECSVGDHPSISLHTPSRPTWTAPDGPIRDIEPSANGGSVDDEDGYALCLNTETPTSESSSALKSGVGPNSLMLARIGTSGSESVKRS